MTPLKAPLILYVDDERPNRLVFEQSFGSRFRITAVASGAEALELLKHEPVAVLVTDQRMPNMSGHELLVRCKTDHPDVIRVVITAYSDLDPILAAINEGLVARYLIKPWNRAELEEILAWGVAAWELGRQDSTLQLRLLRTERLTTIGSLAAAILHDLNQPLGNLHINARRIQELSVAAPIIVRWLDQATVRLEAAEWTQVAELSAELPEVAADVVLSCDMLRDITDSLRRFLQPAAGASSAPPSTDPLPIIHYALRVTQHIRVEAMARGLYDGPAGLPAVAMGATELSQVFINLIANASQALLSAGKDHGKLVVHARAEGDRLRFVVEDNGPGMTPEVLSKVGTPFFSTREQGTGLGIAQCQRLVGAAGGQLELWSEPGRGTRVTFSLRRASRSS